MPQADQNLENLRLHYKPDRIILLLVGESPPPHKGFFYDSTVAEGQLSRTTRKAFQDHYKTEYVDREEFLVDFNAKQCYLTDLFQQRGKTIQEADKREKLEAIQRLTSRLQAEKPKIITPVLKRIRKPVEVALLNSHVPARLIPLTYPTRQYIPRYRSGLQAILSSL